ncbi:hypothetical protein [Maritalea porphyrae]|uniref:hypothetical protein n=1 Tax=Maritalea porphyrae TaxID=880732 RepID=UPI0022AEA3C1|nr:hypothetical protein [Maritalea porphyrae]MCZ4270884.1 hypothetical protein [Maritalea porphyrae]
MTILSLLVRSLFSLAVVCTSAVASDLIKPGVYFCRDTAVGGISFDATSDMWRSTKFKADDEFFLRAIPTSEKITPKDTKSAYQKYEISLKPTGFETYTDCSNDASIFSDLNVYGPVVWCRAFLSRYNFNFENGRFSSAYQIGYVSGDDNNKNTPAISIGTCDWITK